MLDSVNIFKLKNTKIWHIIDSKFPKVSHCRQVYFKNTGGSLNREVERHEEITRNDFPRMCLDCVRQAYKVGEIDICITGTADEYYYDWKES